MASGTDEEAQQQHQNIDDLIAAVAVVAATGAVPVPVIAPAVAVNEVVNPAAENAVVVDVDGYGVGHFAPDAVDPSYAWTINSFFTDGSADWDIIVTPNQVCDCAQCELERQADAEQQAAPPVTPAAESEEASSSSEEKGSDQESEEEEEESEEEEEGPTFVIANDDETPSEIAKRNGWEVTALLKANKHIRGLRADAKLYEGTKLFEPMDEASSSSEYGASDQESSSSDEEVSDQDADDEISGSFTINKKYSMTNTGGYHTWKTINSKVRTKEMNDASLKKLLGKCVL